MKTQYEKARDAFWKVVRYDGGCGSLINGIPDWVDTSGETIDEALHKFLSVWSED